MKTRWIGFALAMVAFALIKLHAADPQPIDLWPAKAPGEAKEFPPEQDVNKPTDNLVGDRKIMKLTNVTTPQITVYEPPKDKRTGCALIIAPGGGHHILAYDHEGTECAEYFAARGITGIVLKYRVPFRNPEKRWEAAVQDAQRAVSLVRSRASDWQLDPQRIGIMGFSAGGETAGLTAILHEQRQYKVVDKVDELSCRPDFAALIYAGGFENKNPWTLQEHIKIDSNTPTMFFAHAQDDNVSVANSVLLFSELKKAKVPGVELHVYASGGHGYGMRNTGHPVNSWPDRCAEWIVAQGFTQATKNHGK